MAKDTVRFSIDIPGGKATIRKLNQLPKELQAKLRDKSGEIAKDLAAKIIAAADREDARARLAAKSVRVRRDRVPAIAAGGAKTVARRGKTKVRGEDVFFGSEFGGQGRRSTQQFEPHLGTVGYWFFPTVRESQDDVVAEWLAAVDEIEQDWSSDAARGIV